MAVLDEGLYFASKILSFISPPSYFELSHNKDHVLVFQPFVSVQLLVLALEPLPHMLAFM